MISVRFASDFAENRRQQFTRKQKYMDSAVLRLNEPYTPKISSTLINSGTLATIIGSGKVMYNAPYASRVYYSKKPIGRYNGSKRGAMWFERMKNDKKAQILREVSQVE